MTNQPDKKLIMLALHEEERDEEGKLIIPASVFKIYQHAKHETFGEWYFASSEQVYAHKNKNLQGRKTFTLDEFKGAKGISQEYYTLNDIKEFITILVYDEYSIQRVTKHSENSLADRLFEHLKAVYRQKERNSGIPLLGF